MKKILVSVMMALLAAGCTDRNCDNLPDWVLERLDEPFFVPTADSFVGVAISKRMR